jgi:hypothetical protein
LRTKFVLGVLSWWLLVGSAAQAAAPTELQPLAFLIGEWASSGEGQPGVGTGTAVFSPSLQDRVILRTSFADYPATDNRPASRHDDLMVIYAVAGGVRANYFDSEGHVIRYSVESPAAGQAVFLSDAEQGAFRFRLTYQLVGDDQLDGTFEIAAPGAPDTFKPYLSWHSHKTQGARD